MSEKHPNSSDRKPERSFPYDCPEKIGEVPDGKNQAKSPTPFPVITHVNSQVWQKVKKSHAPRNSTEELSHRSGRGLLVAEGGTFVSRRPPGYPRSSPDSVSWSRTVVGWSFGRRVGSERPSLDLPSSGLVDWWSPRFSPARIPSQVPNPEHVVVETARIEDN